MMFSLKKDRESTRTPYGSIRVITFFSEDIGEVRYKVQRKDVLLYVIYGNTCYGWRTLNTFESKENALEYAQKARSFVEEVVNEG